MATYVNDLRLKEISTGDESGTWGTSTNTNLELIGEALGYATEQSFGSDADATTTVADGVSDPARAMYFKVTSAGSLTATRTLTIAPNTVSRVMFIENATSGSQSIAISQGSGANVTIATGKTAIVYLDGAGAGAAVVDAMAGVDPGVTDTLAEVLTAGNATGGTDIAVGAGDDVTFSDSSKAIFGVGSDLQIYHDGTDSYITEVGNGNLIVKAAGGTLFQGATAGESLLTLLENGAVTAYYDNAVKLATTSTGIDVTGTVVSDGLTVEKTSSGANVSVASLQNDGSGANTKADLDFHAANTKYATISGGYGASAPELDIKVGNTPSKIVTFTDGGDVSFYEDTGTTPKMFWDASAEFLGIGTTSPLMNLHLSDSGDTGIQMTKEGALASRIKVVSDGLFFGVDASNGDSERVKITNNGDLKINASGNLYIRDTGTFIKEDQGLQIGNTSGTGTTRPIRFFTESAERMRIDSDGDVGVGYTDSIFGKLAVNSNAEPQSSGNITTGFTVGNSTSGTAINIGTYDAGGYSYIKSAYVNSAGTTRNLAFFTGAARSMDLDSNGNVGIGIPTAKAGLHVNRGTSGAPATSGTTQDGTLRLSSAATTGILDFGMNGANPWIQATDSGGLNNNYHIALNPNGGNVGVGTAAPGHKLDINGGNIAVDAGYGLVWSGATARIVTPEDNSVGGLFKVAPSAATRFMRDTAESMRIDGSGNLLVGKTSASATGSGTELRGTQVIIGKTSSGTVNGIYFNHNSSYVGGLNYTDSATSLVTSSDERLKESIADADDAGSKIDAMQVRQFDWKVDGSHQEYGFVAQELEPVFGHAVHTAEDDMQTKGVDYASLVPMLVKEIQSLRNRVAQLENS